VELTARGIASRARRRIAVAAYFDNSFQRSGDPGIPGSTSTIVASALARILGAGNERAAAA